MPVLEAIGDRLRRAVDVDLNSLDFARLDSFDEGRAGETHHSECRRRHRRFMGFEIDGHPDLMRVLRGQAMKPKSRQQADDASRNEFCGDRETVMFGDRRFRKCVDAARRAHEEPLAVESKQRLSGHPKLRNVAGTNQRLLTRQFQNPFGCSLWHVALRR